MPQIAIVPVKHWNFRSIPARIDVERILQEAIDSGESVVRVKAKFTGGIKPYLFVRKDSDDAKALSILPRIAKSHCVHLVAASTFKYTPEGFDFVCGSEDWGWVLIFGESNIALALQLISKQRDLLKRRQRVTVECL